MDSTITLGKENTGYISFDLHMVQKVETGKLSLKCKPNKCLPYYHLSILLTLLNIGGVKVKLEANNINHYHKGNGLL